MGILMRQQYLTRQYIFKGKRYGPGNTEVPDDFGAGIPHLRVTKAKKGEKKRATNLSTLPLDFPYRELLAASGLLDIEAVKAHKGYADLEGIGKMRWDEVLVAIATIPDPPTDL